MPAKSEHFKKLRHLESSVKKCKIPADSVFFALLTRVCMFVCLLKFTLFISLFYAGINIWPFVTPLALTFSRKYKLMMFILVYILLLVCKYSLAY